MRKAIWLVLLTVLTWQTVFASDKLVSRVDIDCLMVGSVPEAEYKNAASVSPKVGASNRWLMVKIEYNVPRSSFKDPALKLRKDGYFLELSGFIDDLRVDVRVLVNTGFKHDGKTIYALCTGETEFYTVRCDGKRHLVQMFIPGKMLDRISRSPNGGIRQAVKNDFAVEVIFSAAGRELARGYQGIAGGRKKFEEALRMVPGNMIFNGWVLPRSQTQWALHETDNLDVEKFPAVNAGKSR